MLRMFHVWTLAGRHEILARDLRDAIARVGNHGGPRTKINGASEPNDVDLEAAARAEGALQQALMERGWRPDEAELESQRMNERLGRELREMGVRIPWKLVATR